MAYKPSITMFSNHSFPSAAANVKSATFRLEKPRGFWIKATGTSPKFHVVLKGAIRDLEAEMGSVPGLSPIATVTAEGIFVGNLYDLRMPFQCLELVADPDNGADTKVWIELRDADRGVPL